MSERVCPSCACPSCACSRHVDRRDALQLGVGLAAVPVKAQLGGREGDHGSWLREVGVVRRHLIERDCDEVLVCLERILALRCLELLSSSQKRI
jgi:hypothetical protein